MPPRQKDNSEFRTSDLYFAAYLQTAGVEMLRTDKDIDHGKIFFIFDTSIANMDDLKQGWFNNTAKVPANPFAYNIRTLKSMCHM